MKNFGINENNLYKYTRTNTHTHSDNNYKKPKCSEDNWLEEKASELRQMNIKTIIELFISWNGEDNPIDVANIDSAVEYISKCMEDNND